MIAAYYTTHATNVGMAVLVAALVVVVLWRSRSYRTPAERSAHRAELNALGKAVQRARDEQRP